MRILIPVLFILSAIAMRRWGFLIPAPTPNLVLALAAACAVRRTARAPYLAGALLAAFAISYPAFLSAAGLVWLMLAAAIYFIAPRLAWRSAVAMPLFIIFGMAALSLFIGEGVVIAREPFRFAGEALLTLAAGGIFAYVFRP